MVDITGPVVQAILFALFGAFTSLLNAITAPTYNGLLVPELAPASLFPSLTGGDSGFLGASAAFSDYLLERLVDPAIVLVVIGLGLLYLARSMTGRETVRLEAALPRLLVYVVLANVVVPVTGAVLDLAGAVYPVVAGFDGGQWQNWENLTGFGSVGFAWDNGALAFVISFALFSIVLLLAAAVALRDALLALLVVLLPLLTLVGAIPTLRPITRRAWLIFGEAAFWPCVVIVPLELAVGSPSVLLLLADLTLALGSPVLISVAGTQLSQLGLPAAGGILSGGIQRGLGVASLGASSSVRPIASLGGAASPGASSAAGGALAAASKASLPLAAPLALGELLGRGAEHLVRHLAPPVRGRPTGGRSYYHRFPPVHRGTL